MRLNEGERVWCRGFKEALNSGKFVVTSEVAPPKGTNLEKMLHHIDLLKDKVDGYQRHRPPELGDALSPLWAAA